MQSISWYKKGKTAKILRTWESGFVENSGMERKSSSEMNPLVQLAEALSPAVRLQLNWEKTTSPHKLDQNSGNKRKKCCVFADTAYHPIPDTHVPFQFKIGKKKLYSSAQNCSYIFCHMKLSAKNTAIEKNKWLTAGH